MDSGDEEHVCHTCKIVAAYIDLSNGFTQDLSNALIGPMQLIYLALVGIWIIFQGYRLILILATIMDVAKEFIFVVIAWFMLTGAGPRLINMIFLACLKTMGAAAAIALNTSNKDQSVAAATDTVGAGMEALVSAAEQGVWAVFGVAEDLFRSAGWSNPGPLLYAVLLALPFVLVLISYFSQVVVAIFRITILATLSPFMMFGYGFGWGRPMAYAGIRTMLSAFMVLFGATLALGIMLYGVTRLGITKSLTPDELRDLASLSNETFLLVLALGWMGTAFMTEATGIANSITGSSLTNTAAGILTAGAAGTALAAATYARRGAGMLLAPSTAPLRAIGAGFGAATMGTIAQRSEELIRKAMKLDGPGKK